MHKDINAVEVGRVIMLRFEFSGKCSKRSVGFFHAQMIVVQ